MTIQRIPLETSKDAPYHTEVVIRSEIVKKYNSHYGDDKKCVCGHSYYRHFDPYENMDPVGCKYCECDLFQPSGK